MTIASIADFRTAARRRLPRFLFEYIDGGSYAEVTLKRNVADLEAILTPVGTRRYILDLGNMLAITQSVYSIYQGQ